MLRAILLLALAGGLMAQETTIEAGLAKVEITPSFFGPMYGYNNRKCGPANGTHDPLFAKVLVLKAGDSKLAIVTVDIGSLVSDKLRKRVADELGIPTLLLAASHTHSGPAFLQHSGAAQEKPNPYLGELETKIFGAVSEASHSMFPAKLGVGRGSIQLGYNRLLLRPDGRSRAMFENPERIPLGPVDPEYTILRLEDAQGNPKALLVHYACHAVVLGPTSCKYSADWPGAMKARVEREMNGVQCMFVQGGAGDINPLAMGRTGKEDEDFATMQKMGELMGEQVLRTGKATHADLKISGPIQATGETLKFSDRWDKDKSLDVGITTVLIGREIAIAAVPGEPMHKIQTMWKTRAEVPVALFYGYTYSGDGVWPGYIPDLKSAAYGGYGADVTTRVEVGAGETIVERHLINLYKMLGMWRDKPGRP